jgi:hypothetical protein
MLLLEQLCQHTKQQQELKNSRYKRNYNYGKIPSYQTIKINNHTITINANLPDIHERINEAIKAQTEKPKQLTLKFPQQVLIERVKTGSHSIENGTHTVRIFGKRVTRPKYYRIDDYETVYHDSLVSGDWLKQHINDDYPEPTIDVQVDDKQIHLNGNYKAGMIKQFIKTNA